LALEKGKKMVVSVKLMPGPDIPYHRKRVMIFFSDILGTGFTDILVIT